MKTTLQAERETSIHLRHAGLETDDIAAQLGRRKRWVQKWWHRFQRGGWGALAG